MAHSRGAVRDLAPRIAQEPRPNGLARLCARISELLTDNELLADPERARGGDAQLGCWNTSLPFGRGRHEYSTKVSLRVT